MKRDKQGQRVTFIVQENLKIPQAKHLLSENSLAELQPLGKTGGSSKFNILVCLQLGNQETPKWMSL